MGWIDSAMTAALAAIDAAQPVIDRAVGAVAPGTARRRAKDRAVLSLAGGYDAARGDKGGWKRIGGRGGLSGEALAQQDAPALRAEARALERNHDLVDGALAVLVRNVVGPEGIGVEPTPRLGGRETMDEIDDDFARSLLNEWRIWCKRPEVTWTMDWAEAQQLACRSWLRDGEIFGQHVVGRVEAGPHGTPIPYSIELIESDMVPHAVLRPGSAASQGGIERNEWGRPVRAWVLRHHPGDVLAGGIPSVDDVKALEWADVIHLPLRKRVSQIRGVSLLASTITRFRDLKDYEESERIAARIAAAIAAYVKRDVGMDWTPPTNADGSPIAAGDRELKLRAGAVLDELAPGEELALLDAKRPNVALADFREGQLRAAAAGLDVSFSSLARDYNGTFSAQRQELVESWLAYRLMTRLFVARFVQPIWERFVATVIASGRVRVPRNIRPETVAQANFHGPAMPWIDPQKEAAALRLMARTGIKSLTTIISERGGRVQDVLEELKRERDLAAELGLILEADAATRAIPPGAINPDGDTSRSDAGDPAGDDAGDDAGDGDTATAARPPRQRKPRQRAARKPHASDTTKDAD